MKYSYPNVNFTVNAIEATPLPVRISTATTLLVPFKCEK
jgi:hypothetical protein